MSQAGPLNLAEGPVPPSVAQSYTTDNGTAVPLANILNVVAIDTTEDNDNGIKIEGGAAETGASNRLQVQLTNRLQGSASAVGAVTADIITFDLGASTAVYRFDFYISGRDTTTGDGVGYTLMGSARTDGASATIIGSPFVDNDEDASLNAASLDLIASANNVVLRATGVAGQTITYKSVGTFLKV